MKPVSVRSVFNKLPKDRQRQIKARAAAYSAEYKNLQELRKSLGFTQNEIAEAQGINQVNISNLERRQDMRISTLKKYVEALGCKLEINIRISDTSLAKIKNLKHK